MDRRVREDEPAEGAGEPESALVLGEGANVGGAWAPGGGGVGEACAPAEGGGRAPPWDEWPAEPEPSAGAGPGDTCRAPNEAWFASG